MSQSQSSQAVVPTWTQLPTSTQSAPPPLTGHVAVVWRNEFIVHGGGTDEGEASDRTYFYDLDARRWVTRELAGQPALARRDHAAALVGERLFLFGGASAAGTELMRTMPVLHLRSRVWSRPAVYGRFPPAVSGHSLTAVGSRLVLLGGRIGQLSALPDVYLFDTDAMAWTRRRAGDAREGALVKGKVPALGAAAPSERVHHLAVSYPGGTTADGAAGAPGVLLFGGGVLGEAGEVPNNELWLLRLADDSPGSRLGWERPLTSGAPPPPLLGHAGCVLGRERVAVFGGWGVGGVHGDLWLLDLASWSWSTAPTAAAAATPLARKGHALVALGAATAALFGGDDLGAAAAKAQAERDARDARAAARGSRHANVQQGTLSARSGAAGAAGVSGGASASSAATQRMLFDDLDLLTLAEPAIEETEWAGDADGSADEAAS